MFGRVILRINSKLASKEYSLIHSINYEFDEKFTSIYRKINKVLADFQFD